jgi:hypothetical protein
MKAKNKNLVRYLLTYNNLELTIIKHVTREVRNFVGISVPLILKESWAKNLAKYKILISHVSTFRIVGPNFL